MQPGGRSVPLARATRTFPSATIEVAPSNTIERSRPGTPMDQGLVERNRACPPNGTTDPRPGPAAPTSVACTSVGRAAGCRAPRSASPTYCGTRMTPWESWPERLARIRCAATTPAISSSAPMALKTASTYVCSGAGRQICAEPAIPGCAPLSAYVFTPSVFTPAGPTASHPAAVSEPGRTSAGTREGVGRARAAILPCVVIARIPRAHWTVVGLPASVLPDGHPLTETARSWLAALQRCVRAVDYAAARPLFAPDFQAFGTHAAVVSGRDLLEREQWRHIWP